MPRFDAVDIQFQNKIGEVDGKRPENITARRMILRDVLKYGNGLRFSIRRRYVPAMLDLTKFPLTKPAAALAETASGLPEGILEITKNMRLKIRKTRRRDLK